MRLILLILLALPTILAASFQVPPLKAESVILMNAETGRVLYEKNARTPFYPASTTKIATTLFVLEQRGEKLQTMVEVQHDAIASLSPEAKKRSNYTVPAWWVEIGGTHIGLKRGEVMSIFDLLHGVMLASGNDAANAVAQYMGGTISQFMSDLNDFLKTIGCRDTYFCNPHGLHHPKHLTTAYDLALMTQFALKNPTFCEIVSKTRHPRPKTNKQEPSTLVQGNALLKKGKFYYPKAFGVKTGYTEAAGHNLVAAAKSSDRKLIIVMKCKDRTTLYENTIALFEAAFAEKKVQKKLFRRGLQKMALSVPGSSTPIPSYLKEDIALDYYPSEIPKIKSKVEWDSIELPVKKHQKIGLLQILDTEGRTIKTAPLFSAADVEQGWMDWIKSFF